MLSVLLFFFPLLAIQVPLAGEQEVSGYDVISRLNAFRNDVKSAGVQQPSNEPTANSSEVTNTSPSISPEMPLSLEISWLIPFELAGAFLSALIALIGILTNLRAARAASAFATCSSAIAILHVKILNSDLHSWLSELLKTQTANDPFAGLEVSLANLAINSFQLRPGWALYGLLTLLGITSGLLFSRILASLRVPPDANV